MELALGQKGPVAPPPKLDQPYRAVAKTIADWSHVAAATHWHLSRRGVVDGVDFYVNDHELGHIHLDGQVHLATNHFLCNALRRRELAEEFPYAGYEHWVSFSIRSTIDANHATWLFHLNYLRLQGTDEQNLLNQISESPTSTTNQTEY